MDIGIVVVVLSIVVLLVVVVQFNEVLGRRTGKEKTISNIPTIKNITEKFKTAEDADASQQIIDVENILQDIDELAPQDSDINKKLRQIYDIDKGFSPKAFVKNAVEEYENCLTAFASDKIENVTNILTPAVRDAFLAQIAEYKAQEQHIDFKFVGNAKAEIVGVEIIENVAYIAMRFISEAVFALRDKEDKIIQGRSNDLTILDEKWVFRKALPGQEALWQICATTY